MSIPLSTIENRLRQWIISATGLNAAKVIIANQNAPKPSMPYATIDPVLSIKKVSMYDEEDWEDGAMTYRPVRRCMASIQYFGDNAKTELSDCLTALDNSNTYLLFRNDGIALADRSGVEIKDLSAKTEDGVFLPRALIEFEYDVECSKITDNSAGYFDNGDIEIEITYEELSNTELNPVDVEIFTNSVANDPYTPVSPVFDVIVSDITSESAVVSWSVE